MMLYDLSYNYHNYVLALSYNNPEIKSYQKMIVRYFVHRARL